jgi:hypothetical protein
MYECGNYPIEAIEKFFDSLILPEFIQLNSYTRINNVKEFVKVHIAYLKNNNNNFIFFQYYKRLIALKELLVKMEEW